MVARTLESTNKTDRPVAYTVLEMLLTYQDEGMTARSRGFGFDTNPFLVKERLPQTTGEPVGDWRQKAEAWLFGWLLENAWTSEFD